MTFRVKLSKKAGVTLDYNQASGDAKEKLNLMLASNDYPDLILIDRSSGMIDKFISAKALIPLEDLIEEYAPNIKEQYGEYLNRSKSEDGHIYGLPNWYGIDEEPVLAFMIRKDYLSEVAPEEVVNGDRPITQSEFIEYLKAFKKSILILTEKQVFRLQCGRKIGEVLLEALRVCLV